MYGLKTRYLASAFVDADDIVPNNRDMSELLRAIGDDRFLPQVSQELTPFGTRPRMTFRTLDGGSSLVLQGLRFDFIKLPTPDSSDIGDFAEFCESAVRVIVVATNYLRRRAHRL